MILILEQTDLKKKVVISPDFTPTLTDFKIGETIINKAHTIYYMIEGNLFTLKPL